MIYSDLIVWQKGIELVKEIYKLVSILPNEEKYALSDQMRRSAVSIPSNIAEGYERGTTKDYIRFLMISKGSRAELETQLHICIELNYLSKEETETAFSLCGEIKSMLVSMIKKLGGDLQ